MTPTACLWLSNWAGEGAAGSSASVDILSRTVPITRVLHTECNVTAYTTALKSSGDGNNNNRIIEKYMVIIVFSYLVEELIDAKLNQPLNTSIK